MLRLLLGILILMLLLLSILRKNTVGGDLINYIPLYDTIAKSSFGEALAIPKYGIIYLFYNKILTLLSPNEFTFMLGTSLVNLLPVFWLIIKYSKIPLLSIFLYVSIGYYTNTFNSVRSSMAIAITICCIPYILERKFYSFLFLYILALCVHLSSFPFILTYWVVNLKLSFKRIISLIVFSYLLSESVSNWIIGYLYLYDPVYDKFESTTGGYSYFFMLFFIFISGYIIYNQNKDKNISKENDLFLRVMLIATCIQPFAFHFMLINRIVLFFSVYIIIFRGVL
ncbi:EpsG family protein [Bacteroides fragilis]|uniref:EpsG family protein n=1 Tax=Bacteroides fragilis TaxID=817 RepID=UPI0039B3C0D9